MKIFSRFTSFFSPPSKKEETSPTFESQIEKIYQKRFSKTKTSELITEFQSIASSSQIRPSILQCTKLEKLVDELFTRINKGSIQQSSYKVPTTKSKKGSIQPSSSEAPGTIIPFTLDSTPFEQKTKELLETLKKNILSLKSSLEKSEDPFIQALLEENPELLETIISEHFLETITSTDLINACKKKGLLERCAKIVMASETIDLNLDRLPKSNPPIPTSNAPKQSWFSTLKFSRSVPKVNSNSPLIDPIESKKQEAISSFLTFYNSLEPTEKFSSLEELRKGPFSVLQTALLYFIDSKMDSLGDLTENSLHQQGISDATSLEEYLLTFYLEKQIPHSDLKKPTRSQLHELEATILETKWESFQENEEEKLHAIKNIYQNTQQLSVKILEKFSVLAHLPEAATLLYNGTENTSPKRRKPNFILVDAFQRCFFDKTYKNTCEQLKSLSNRENLPEEAKLLIEEAENATTYKQFKGIDIAFLQLTKENKEFKKTVLGNKTLRERFSDVLIKEGISQIDL